MSGMGVYGPGSPRVNASNIGKLIMLAASRAGHRLFRMNVGMGWAGEAHKFTRAETVTAQPGDVLIRKARPFHSGVKGMGDYCGWASVEVTPDMVGSRLAVFASVEVKAGRDKLRPEQESFMDAVNAAGGMAGVARSEPDAMAILQGEFKRPRNP